MPEGDIKYNQLVKVIEGWKAKDFLLPIEQVSKDLFTVYTYEELQDLEFEYLASQVAKVLGFSESDKYVKVLDDNFFPKLDCILALLKNPYELLDDVIAFVNTILVCNDAPICGEDIVLVPTHFIERGLYAINKILPKDMELHDVYWSSNIQHYIFTCFSADSCYMLPKMIQHLEDDMFNSVLKSDDIRKDMRNQNIRLRELAHGIVQEIKTDTDEVVTAMDKESQENIINNFLDVINSNDNMSEPDKLAMMKYIKNYVYKRFYRQLTPKIEEFK